MRRQLQSSGFNTGRTLSVSHFRVPVLKKIVPTAVLAGLDGLLQGGGRWFQLSPSVFVHNRVPHAGKTAAPGTFFACPTCKTPLGEVVNDQLVCPNPQCGRKWAVIDGLYDFKEPVD
jgi:hypothetical protein